MKLNEQIDQLYALIPVNPVFTRIPDFADFTPHNVYMRFAVDDFLSATGTTETNVSVQVKDGTTVLAIADSTFFREGNSVEMPPGSGNYVTTYYYRSGSGPRALLVNALGDAFADYVRSRGCEVTSDSQYIHYSTAFDTSSSVMTANIVIPVTYLSPTPDPVDFSDLVASTATGGGTPYPIEVLTSMPIVNPTELASTGPRLDGSSTEGPLPALSLTVAIIAISRGSSGGGESAPEERPIWPFLAGAMVGRMM